MAVYKKTIKKLILKLHEEKIIHIDNWKQSGLIIFTVIETAETHKASIDQFLYNNLLQLKDE